MRGSEDPEAARLSWQPDRRFQIGFGRSRVPRGRSNYLDGVGGGKKLPRALFDQTRALGTRERRSPGNERAGRTLAPAPSRAAAPRTQPGAESSAGSAGSGARARGDCGEGEQLCDQRKPWEGAGWGRARRSRGLTRGPAGSRESGAAGVPGRLGAGERGRWRALCWEERAVGLTGNAPDQVPDQ